MQPVRSFIILLLVSLISLTTTYADDLNEKLITAGKTGDTATVKSSIEKGANVNAKDKLGQTALIVAAKNGHVETVQTLISQGADVDAQDLFEKSSLHYGARNGDVEVAKALLIKGADVNKKNLGI